MVLLHNIPRGFSQDEAGGVSPGNKHIVGVVHVELWSNEGVRGGKRNKVRDKKRRR